MTQHLSAQPVRAAAALFVVALLLAACGTRVDRDHYEQVLAQEGGQTGGGGEVAPGGTDAQAGDGTREAPASAAPDAGGGDEPAGGGASQQGGTESDTGPGGGADPQAPPTTADAAGQAAAGDQDAGEVRPISDEVVGEVITVGMHVPETGAAPMPMDWEDVLDMVVEYFNEEQPIHGRTLELVVEDDGYDPAMARAACRRLLDAEPLLVIGHTMPAAQDACAALFDDHDIPYLMRGTTPAVLADRPLAFFGTAPDDLQGRLLADYVISEHRAAERPVGVLYQDDQLAARDSFVARIEEAGGEVPVVEEGTPRQSDYAATIQRFRQADVELVFLSTPPVDAIQIAVQAHGEGYGPRWLGGGTYWNYNMTLEAAGSAMDGAVSLSPWPTIDSPDASEFRDVYRRYFPDREPTDIGLIMWGWSNLLHELLDEAGPDLSRRAVLETLQDFRFARPYWTPVDYGNHGPTGTTHVAVHRADGQAREWRPTTGFVEGF